MAKEVVTLAAKMRESVGKGTARAVRRNEEVPAVIYGDKKAPVTISIEAKMLTRYVNAAGFFTRLFDIELGGKKHRVLPRDVQFDPVSDRPLHADFLRVSTHTKVRVFIPVHFLGQDKCPGIKRGGTLNIVHHELEVSCAPDRIPDRFEINLETYALGDAVHLSAIKMPEGVALTTHEKDFTIASIAVPSSIRSEADDAAAAAPAADGAAAPAADGKAAAAPAAGKAAAPAAGKAPAGGKAAPAAAAKPAAKK